MHDYPSCLLGIGKFSWENWGTQATLSDSIKMNKILVHHMKIIYNQFPNYV